MKLIKNTALILMLLSLVMFSSCDDDHRKVRGEGPTATETRFVRSFDELRLKVDGDVYLTQGPAKEIRIEAQRNILDIIETDVRNHRLEVTFGRHWVNRHNGIRIYITTPDINALTVDGSGSIVGENALTTHDLNLYINGSGRIDLEIERCDQLNSDINGSGDIYLEGGSCEIHDVDISGSGKVRAFSLLSRNVDVNISGSGNCELNVQQKLEARISGSGTIYYKGNPSVNSRISGSGKVVSSE